MISNASLMISAEISPGPDALLIARFLMILVISDFMIRPLQPFLVDWRDIGEARDRMGEENVCARF